MLDSSGACLEVWLADLPPVGFNAVCTLHVKLMDTRLAMTTMQRFCLQRMTQHASAMSASCTPTMHRIGTKLRQSVLHKLSRSVMEVKHVYSANT